LFERDTASLFEDQSRSTVQYADSSLIAIRVVFKCDDLQTNAWIRGLIGLA